MDSIGLPRWSVPTVGYLYNLNFVSTNNWLKRNVVYVIQIKQIGHTNYWSHQLFAMCIIPVCGLDLSRCSIVLGLIFMHFRILAQIRIFIWGFGPGYPSNTPWSWFMWINGLYQGNVIISNLLKGPICPWLGNMSGALCPSVYGLSSGGNLAPSLGGRKFFSRTKMAFFSEKFPFRRQKFMMTFF